MKAPVLAIAIPRHHDDGGGDDGDMHDMHDDGDFEDCCMHVADCLNVPEDKCAEFCKALEACLEEFDAKKGASEEHDDGGKY